MASLIRERAASTREMSDAFGDAALLAAALAFETALAQAQVASGLISTTDGDAIVAACRGGAWDVAALADAAAHAGTMAIPLVAELRTRVALRHPEAAKRVHLGATSQDLADTALMLQARAGVALLTRDLAPLQADLAALAQAHAATPMLGRTLLQAALPITFGLKLANWLAGIDAVALRLEREADAALSLQLGGAAGTRTQLGGEGAVIAQAVATALGLGCPALPWQSRRDGVAGLGAALAILIGALGKIARDVSLLAQSEVAEAFEPRVAGRGGSSAMAHKRNPTSCQVALSAALRAPGLAAALIGAMPQEHERGLGGWQAEGAVLAELFQLAHAALAAMATVVAGLEVDTQAMVRNLRAAQVGADAAEAEALVAAALQARTPG